MKVLLISECK